MPLPPPAAPNLSTRAHPRLKFATPVQVQFGGRVFVCSTEDISLGGLRAKYRQPPPGLTRLRLLFNLPTGSSVHTDGIVRYARSDHFGVQFAALPSQAQEALDEYTCRTLGYTRRGDRMAKRLTVTLRSLKEGAEDEVAETVVLSRRGGRLVCRARFKIGEELRLSWPERNRAAQVRVVYRRLCGPGELTEMGFEFLDSADFWQMEAAS